VSAPPPKEIVLKDSKSGKKDKPMGFWKAVATGLVSSLIIILCVGCGTCEVANFVVKSHPNAALHAAGGRTICATCDGKERQCITYDKPGPALSKCLGLK